MPQEMGIGFWPVGIREVLVWDNQHPGANINETSGTAPDMVTGTEFAEGS